MIPRIFIVDDEAPARQRLKTLLSDIITECPHQLVGEADHAHIACDHIRESRPDIILLDVQMPGMTGIQLAEILAGPDFNAPSVIFISAYDEFALKAFDVHALDYLLKPVRAERLADAIQRVVRMRSQAGAANAVASAENRSPRRRHFSVQERGRVLLVPVSEVIYLKAEQKYVTLRTREHEYLIEESLLSIEEELAEVLVRVHRNALVAREAIIGVERGTVAVDAEAEGGKNQETWQVILRSVEERLPISRRQWPIVKSLVR
ncbi:response regulator transcription factor [Oxalobacteraceae bacterium R-40]|uniref:Response regulator transcription factor n=1 Tax=Keguizhuia sedimenti TaxID=3064264 RepID=A0ABU1BN02_9BURK|nr:response regulator transcription factor [Oxalobacteraceae bacterium R-40]